MARGVPLKMLLLDTCALIWLATDHTKLSEEAIKLISQNAGNLFISSFTSFEIAIKHLKKKLTLPIKPSKWIPEVLEYHGIIEIPVDSEIAICSVNLPHLHNDPADRIIIATSMIKNIPILSPDSLMKKYPHLVVRW
jgi:PIN domain nuclease of toxin-antitoxin system